VYLTNATARRLGEVLQGNSHLTLNRLNLFHLNEEAAALLLQFIRESWEA
jgi:hypothetical protein